jgi:amino acid adenylation domain-containing protein
VTVVASSSSPGALTPVEARKLLVRLLRRLAGDLRTASLSFAQERLWFVEQMHPGNAAYHLPFIVPMSAALDLEVLGRAVDEIVRRHESLRTTFAVSGGVPVQRIAAPAPVPIERIEVARAEDMSAIIADRIARPFDFENGPLFRAHVLLSAGSVMAIFNMHHIVADGWSLGVFIRELQTLYRAFSAGQPSSLPDLPMQYAEYARWQRELLSGAVLEERAAFWRETLAGAPPLLDLPTDRPRPAIESLRGAIINFRVPAATSERLEPFAREHDATLFMLLLAVFSGLLSRVAGQEVLVVGSAVANRTHPDLEQIIGFFVNMLPLRCDLRGDPSLREILARVRSVAIAAFDHQDVPFEKLVEILQPRRSLGHSPIFQVVLTLQNAPAGELSEGDGGAVDPTPIPSTAKFDISVSLRATRHGILGACEFRTDLFEGATVDALIERYVALLDQLVNGPDLPLSQWPNVSDPDAAAIAQLLRRDGAGDLAALLDFDPRSRVAVIGAPLFADAFRALAVRAGARPAEVREATHLYADPVVLAALRPMSAPAATQLIVAGPPCFDAATRAWRGKVAVRELWSFEPFGFVALDGHPLPGIHMHIGGAPFGVWSELHVARAKETFVATNQIACIRRDGTLRWRGARERMRNVHGLPFDPLRLESLLRQQPIVADALVVIHEEAILAVVQPVQGRTLFASDIAQLVRNQAPECSPDRILIAPVQRGDEAAIASLVSESEKGVGLVTSRTPVEAILSRIWAEVLARPYIDVRENFFEIGGNSLTSVQIIARIRDALHVELPLHRLFEASTIEDLARVVEAEYEPGLADAERREGEPPEVDGLDVPRVRRAPPGSRRRAPLSYAQERLWFLDQLDGASSVYNVLTVVPLAAWVDPAIVQRAVTEIVDRHEVLRTFFPIVAGMPQQVVSDFEPPRIPIISLGSLPAEERFAELARITEAESRKVFDLAHAPLFRAKMILCGDAGAYLLACTHHIVWDGWSAEVFTRELLALYTAFSRDEPSPLRELSAQYTDFARWQRRWMTAERLAPHLDHWSERLRGLPELVSFPPDSPRPAVESHRGAARAYRLPRSLTESLRHLARNERTTLFAVVLAGFAALVSRVAGIEDIVVGSPVANRTRAEIEPLIGFFANTIVLRVNTGGDPDFRELLSRAHAVVSDATEHQDFPFEKLVEALHPERSLDRNPLFQLMLILQPHGTQATPPPETLLIGPPMTATAKFDATFTLQQSGDALDGTIEYATDVFRHESMERILRELATLLAAAASAPSTRLSELPLVDASEAVAWLRRANAPYAPGPFQSVVSMFDRSVTTLPDAIAIVDASLRVTYSELNARANRLAHRLIAAGVRRGSAVAISLPRGVEMMVAVLGVLKTGAAYVPIDPTYPAMRRQLMFDMARCAVVIGEAPSESVLRVAVDGEGDPNDPTVTIAQDDLCYIIFTSGSTGIPKGVGMPHRAMANLIAWQIKHPELARAAITLQFSSLSFDVSFQEIFSTWCNGGTLVLTTEAIRADPRKLLRQLVEHRVDRLFMPYVAIQQLAEAAEAEESLPPLREVISAGEQLRVTTAMRTFFSRIRGCVLRNQYGPTESHVMTDHCLRGSPAAWPLLPLIGKPIANVTAYVLDAHMRPLSPGVIGELYLGGDCVATGYVYQPRLTADRFLPDPWNPSRALYRTGDRARWLENGDIEYFGRGDDQVKVRGFRIEPGEIEAAIMQISGVAETVVVAHGDSSESRRLVAYVVFSGGAQQRPADVISILRSMLPHYMVPSIVVPLDHMPLTPSGKIARRTLPPPAVKTKTEDAPPETPLARLIVEQWRALLGLSLGAGANFFAAGGHSLLATQALSKLRAVTGVDLPLRLLFERPTPASLAEAVIETIHERVLALGSERLVASLERQFAVHRNG